MPNHTQTRELATVDDALTARRISDALNSRMLARRNHAERFDTALATVPDTVRSTLRQLPLDPALAGLVHPPLAAHLRHTPVDGILMFPTTSCTPGRCHRCGGCVEDCCSCPICDSDDPCENCLPPALTPRTARVLIVAAGIIAEECYDAIDRTRPGELVDDSRRFLPLPPWLRGQDSDFIRRMGHAFDDLEDDLTAGIEPRPRSMAEQLALHLMLDYTDTLHADLADLLDANTRGLPETPYDYAYQALRTVLFEDEDHLQLLYRVDIPAAPGTLDELFDPFQADLARNPNRNVRR